MSVIQNFKLCHGKISEAGHAGKHTCNCKLKGLFMWIHIFCIGETAVSIASKLHEPSLQLAALLQHLWTHLILLK